MVEIKSTRGDLIATFDDARQPNQCAFTGHKLDGANFAGAQLASADFSSSRLNGADFSRADLYRVKFRGTCLIGATFEGANLFGVDFRKASLMRADFRNADLRQLRVNWCSHDLVAEILRRAARADLDKLHVAGLILLQRQWRAADFIELGHPQTAWVLETLRPYVREDDEVPDGLEPLKHASHA
jgi:uncharacterized protein YjbI with pentapeptide repeats